MVPHITDAVQDWIERVAHVPVDNSSRVPDVCVIEVGWLAHPPALAHHSRHAAATRADGKQLVPPVLTGTGENVLAIQALYRVIRNRHRQRAPAGTTEGLPTAQAAP